ncbi:right-handed parallel beta-helix repeat-containing protein [Tenacibaculum maritimum]|uniref:right-handed parallel beta-helix repeat-containing protein n=1 Tax=Tenacibaculum maritimum TaxID=107401 RepID=UPI001E5A3BB2|nr:right-handed parallel beta-helix repeat-containing protein [Tenacibaculum maritimum]MCD9562690.1 right-handed parallel beta-helix repeat-containing protein [Tenacibaculum maritimum]MCD9564752.1 right-handed parallel beta-helix repeat-containing protein [Tenacibaculum maritimum]MCD9577881.1 right-handed parallel beta-helix repeat-containing protein [Tenacibaculum maritimum]MCD9596765.1 right-handed parallel beta-helix repeat-containing protein [Tenacibaculum maritimum]MCD9612403.1 right-hand
MKNLILQPRIVVIAMTSLLVSYACESELDNTLPQKAVSAQLKTTNMHMITNGMDLTAINGVLSQAQSGDVIEVESGTYDITGKLELKEGITLRKVQGKSSPVFNAQFKTDGMLEQDWKTGNKNVTIQGIVFQNIRFKINAADNTRFSYCIFDYGVRKAGTDKWKDTNDAYIQIVNSTNMKVESCVFKRRAGNSGRGIFVKQSNDTKITKNTFGDTDATAYFVTAINDNSTRTLIEENIINRNASWVKKEETDHGIYAHSFDGLTVNKNTISGWPANGEGGAVKARNGKNLTITENTMNDSGIILNVYKNLPTNYLENVVIVNNKINLKLNTKGNNIYSGIGYWKDTNDVNYYEKSIRIEGNTLTNGFLNISASNLDTANFNENGGGIRNNTAAEFSIPSGIDQSNNTII